jgi:hypothetical protein
MRVKARTERRATMGASRADREWGDNSHPD